MNLEYYEGRKFCVVFVKVIDQKAGKMQLKPYFGRASVEDKKLLLMSPEGGSFAVPHTALPNILPNDGTDLLKDCEYYVLVKTDAGIDFEDPDYA